MLMTEDEVRDKAKIILGFDKIENGVVQGTGQITTFNQLGFDGCRGKPDGWYLPIDTSYPSIVLETKSGQEDIRKEKWEKELFRNIDVLAKRYSKIIGILYNGQDVRVFKGKIELEGISKNLEHKSYYFQMWDNKMLDKSYIMNLTKKVNDILHFDFGISDLQDRMMFTASALVAQSYDLTHSIKQTKDIGYGAFHNWAIDILQRISRDNKTPNMDISILIDEFSNIHIDYKNNQTAINDFIDYIAEISNEIENSNWNGEDIMAIFFNEFNRYRKKAEAGQVFTPEHIASLMYHLIDVTSNDRVLDATCGSGTFLIKAMNNMIKENGGEASNEAIKIKQNNIFGVEMSKKIYSLACANLILHKNYCASLRQEDARTEEIGQWIRKNKITKVLMNPPFERKYGCLKIVKNVLDNVPRGALCAFIMPEKKLEKDNGSKLLKDHTLLSIIKLPDNLFLNIGVSTSIFIFEAGSPQKDKNIKGYYIENDGFATVKKSGRQDKNNEWPKIEEYWVKAYYDGEDAKYNSKQLINPHKHLSYQKANESIQYCLEDFAKVVMSYVFFEKKIDIKEFKERIADNVLYSFDKQNLIEKGDNK